MVLVSFVILALCIGALFYLSTFLVDGLTLFSHKLKLSTFVVGTLILAVATSSPEIVDVTVSSIIGAGDLGVGDVLGSSITNICLVLGLVAVIRPVRRITKSQLKDSIAVVLVSILFFILLVDSFISRIDAVILLSVFAFYHYFLHRKEIAQGASVFFKELKIPFIMVPLALFGIVVVGWVFVNTSVNVASELGIPLSVFGLTVVALSTSLPEIASGITAALEHRPKITFGDVLGSNVTNFTFVIGLASLINPISISSSVVFFFTLVTMLLLTFVLTFMTRKERDLNRKEGFALLGAYFVYLIILVSMA